MIQRIQSLYLLISAILVAFLFVLPIAEILSGGVIYQFYLQGVSLDGVIKNSGLILSILTVVVFLGHGFAVLSYKNRTRQIRIIAITILLLLGVVGMFYYFAFSTINEPKVSFNMGAVFPFVAIILDYMAIRAINKDEALIRSIDRIR